MRLLAQTLKKIALWIYHKGFIAYWFFVATMWLTNSPGTAAVVACIGTPLLLAAVRIAKHNWRIYKKRRRYKQAAGGCFNDEHTFVNLEEQNFDGTIIIDGARLVGKTDTFICNGAEGECYHFFFAKDKFRIYGFTAVVTGELALARRINQERQEEHLPSLYQRLSLKTSFEIEPEEEDEIAWDPAIEEFLKSQ